MTDCITVTSVAVDSYTHTHTHGVSRPQSRVFPSDMTFSATVQQSSTTATARVYNGAGEICMSATVRVYKGERRALPVLYNRLSDILQTE